MNKEQADKAMIKLWLEKADDALASAKLEFEQGHVSFTVNRLYYSCFYAVTALLLKDGKQFTRHSAVMSEFNRAYVKTNRIDIKWGKLYQKLFDDRQEGDYIPTVKFDDSEVSEQIKLAESFLSIVRNLVSSQ
jgi:uncharacterized protein (UPF0332 family)